MDVLVREHIGISSLEDMMAQRRYRNRGARARKASPPYSTPTGKKNSIEATFLNPFETH